jgi:ferredoxin--NADP+ reductase
MVGAPDDDFLEFFSIVVPGGEFSEPLAQLQLGAKLRVDSAPYGLLTLERLAPGPHLWLLGSGTGLAPFLSMLQDPSTWRRFETVVLAHSVRAPEELAYREHMPLWLKKLGIAPNRFVYVPVITRRHTPGTLQQRLPALIANGALESWAGLPLQPDQARAVVCGNPDMVGELRALLKTRGFTTSRREKPGQLLVENYW